MKNKGFNSISQRGKKSRLVVLLTFNIKFPAVENAAASASKKKALREKISKIFMLQQR
jgi:hypothetical protein